MKNFFPANKQCAAAVVGLGVAISTISFMAQATEVVSQSQEYEQIGVVDKTIHILEDASYILGLSYIQMTYKSNSATAIGNTQITDNGALNPIIELKSREKTLAIWPLRVGNFIIGWSVNAAVSQFDTHYQLNSAFRGQDIGTKVSGEYIGMAPTLFLKMGPLYPGRDIFWSAGYGIGPGIFKGSGTAYFNTPQGGAIQEVGSSSPVLAVYQAVNWELQVDHWHFNISAKILNPQGSERSSLEAYGFGLAYRFGF